MQPSTYRCDMKPKAPRLRGRLSKWPTKTVLVVNRTITTAIDGRLPRIAISMPALPWDNIEQKDAKHADDGN